MKQNILFIIPWLPYPITSGGHQALFNGIAAIKDDFDIYITYEATDDEKYRKAEKDFLEQIPNAHLLPLLHQPYRPTLKQKIIQRLKRILKYNNVRDDINDVTKWWKETITPGNRSWIEHVSGICSKHNFDIIQVEMPWRISDIFALPQNSKRIFVHHELGFVRRELEAKQYNNKYIDAVRLFVDKNEIEQLNLYDSVITLSEVDRKKLLEAGVRVPVYSSFAIVDAKETLEIKTTNVKRLTFVGPDLHTPNLVGITWFLENCWKQLKTIDPHYSLDIIGRWSDTNKNAILEKYKDVNFLGYVNKLEDALVGSVMIVPITIGSGIRMKILEACNIGVPFVSTSVGAEGIPVVDGKNCFVTDDPERFVESIIKLQNDDLKKEFISNANRMVKESYSINALRNNRLQIYENICRQ